MKYKEIYLLIPIFFVTAACNQNISQAPKKQVTVVQPSSEVQNSVQQPQTSRQPTDGETSQNSDPNTATYSNSTYGFNFVYPVTTSLVVDGKLISGTGENALKNPDVVVAFYDYSDFQLGMSDGGPVENVTYIPGQKQWLVRPGVNQPFDQVFCPGEENTNQGVNFYNFGYNPDDPLTSAFVTSHGIVVIEDWGKYVFVDPARVVFTDPSQVYKVTCSK